MRFILFLFLLTGNSTISICQTIASTPNIKVLTIEMVKVDNTYSIGKYEVTQSQWKSVMGNNPSYFKGANLPVESISWDDVQEFIKKLNKITGKKYRLPTVDEWEKAAKGGFKSKRFEYAGSDDIEEVAWCYYNSNDKTHPVGTKKANELGIYDMSGNVWEWCSDLTDYPPRYRYYRGGGYGNQTFACAVTMFPQCCDDFPSTKGPMRGFRLALSL